MKSIITAIALLLVCNVSAQLNLNIGVDPKLAIWGTDNEFTTHDGVLNIHGKVEYFGREDGRIYFAIGVEYANLREKYLAWFLDAGVPITIPMTICEDLLLIPQFEFGSIYREHIKTDNYDTIKWDDRYYYGLALSVRYPIDNLLSIGLEGSVDRAPDLPKRGFRYGGKIELIFKII